MHAVSLAVLYNYIYVSLGKRQWTVCHVIERLWNKSKKIFLFALFSLLGCEVNINAFCSHE
jgi:hypothetical protein